MKPQVLAEAVGTFMLVFCIGGIIANMHFMGIETGLMEYAATAGLTVIVIVFSIGSISGAHVNPAVTIAFATVGPFPWSQVPLYILGQVGGSVLATYAGRMVYAYVCLLLITLFLQLGNMSGFAAGVAICLGVLITGPVSGGSMNPARSLGPAIVSWRFDHLWIYVVAPTIGAIAGVFAYRVLRLQGWSCESDPSTRSLQVIQSSLH
ncbi:hypothetical protein BUALT_Bualt14G0087100 [Buddleja alternifolia]|uniref:Aquaporin n=1 Tax=Buddleja alternifolia TaxID=168488 RepID=A0AAV6WPH4_9LAMI|nr:hypothetical protein BUALT_Bualt14G0087100 [Buddleja alternifolia]